MFTLAYQLSFVAQLFNGQRRTRCYTLSPEPDAPHSMEQTIPTPYPESPVLDFSLTKGITNMWINILTAPESLEIPVGVISKKIFCQRNKTSYTESESAASEGSSAQASETKNKPETTLVSETTNAADFTLTCFVFLWNNLLSHALF